MSSSDACEIHLQIHGFRFSLQGGGVSNTIGIDAFSFCSAEETAIALVMDKVIEEILKYRKYKVWRCLDDNSLLALEKKDGDIIATGRHPETQGLLPMEAIMERGFFKVNEHFETSVPGIYAIGDIVYGGIQLAHAAEAEGKAAAAAIAGKKRAIDIALVPQCVYTIPEIAAVGISEDQAKKDGLSFKTSRVVMGSNAKSLIADEGGYMKIFTDQENHMLGPSSSAAAQTI